MNVPKGFNKPKFVLWMLKCDLMSEFDYPLDYWIFRWMNDKTKPSWVARD